MQRTALLIPARMGETALISHSVKLLVSVLMAMWANTVNIPRADSECLSEQEPINS